MAETLEAELRNTYEEALEKTLQDVLQELKKLGLVSDINIMYWKPEDKKYYLIKLYGK